MNQETISREAYTPSLIANDSNNRANKTGRTPRKRKTSTTETQIEREHLFWEVTLAYRKRSQSLVNRNPDATGRKKSRTAAKYVTDVESATRASP